jgi:hypothetical protein
VATGYFPVGMNFIDPSLALAAAIQRDEVWLEVPGTHALYAVSNLGRLARIKNNRGLPREPKIVGSGRDEEGYRICNVMMFETLVGRVHRVVAKTFIPNPKNLPEVDHLDGDTGNNRVANLEWVSAEENQRRRRERRLARAELREWSGIP